jgi:hypothetical protein
MKVRTVITADYPDWWRRGIRRWYGKNGLASRAEIQDWVGMYGTSMDDDIAHIEQERGEMEMTA